jgi:DNA polymerase V
MPYEHRRSIGHQAHEAWNPESGGLGCDRTDDARALMTVTGGRTVHELRGISCLLLDLMEPTRKGIAVTRSFGAPVTLWTEMREAIASYATRAAEKMRRYKVAADILFVFMHTSTFSRDPFY